MEKICVNERPAILIITGPTATGKTDCALELALRMDGEIVSADSMLVYRGMDIGTAKPTVAQRARVPHHMIDVADPSEPFSAAAWQQGAHRAIQDILRRGKLPIVVGGTGLYVRAVQYPMDFAGVQADPNVRRKWEIFLRDKGPQALHEALLQVDPETAALLPVGDTRRAIRALEIFETTGESKSQRIRRDAQRPPRYRALTMAVNLPRAALYERIDRRVDQMMEQGLVEEVRAMMAGGLSPGTTAMQGLGYKEIAAYLTGQLSLPEAIETVKRRTRNFAKRQITWFSKYPDILWLSLQGACENQRITDFFIDNAQSFLGNL